jgi:hypothetical protein
MIGASRFSTLIPGSGVFQGRLDASDALFIELRCHFWPSEPYLTFG